MLAAGATGVRPIIFHVEAAGVIRPVGIRFASEAEVRRVRAWRKIRPATDAGEFAALAAKRWFYYTREGAAVGSIQELRVGIERNQESEFAFLLLASAEWAKRYSFLGLAYCRRTWCHHLVLDFLAVRPGLSFGNRPIRGIGSGIIYSLVRVAEFLGIETIWGEATASSAPFYERVLQTRPVKDLFVIERDAMRRIEEYYLANQGERLAKPTRKGHSD
jgi:hypothetical protein